MPLHLRRQTPARVSVGGPSTRRSGVRRYSGSSGPIAEHGVLAAPGTQKHAADRSHTEPHPLHRRLSASDGRCQLTGSLVKNDTSSANSAGLHQRQQSTAPTPMELAFEGSAGLQSRSTALLPGPFGLGSASQARNTTAGSNQVSLIETFVHEE